MLAISRLWSFFQIHNLCFSTLVECDIWLLQFTAWKSGVKTLKHFSGLFYWIYNTNLLNDYENVLIFLLNFLDRAPFALAFKPGWLAEQDPNQYFHKAPVESVSTLGASLTSALFLSRNVCMDTFICGGLLTCSHQLQSNITEYALVYFHKGKENDS